MNEILSQVHCAFTKLPVRELRQKDFFLSKFEKIMRKKKSRSEISETSKTHWKPESNW